MPNFTISPAKNKYTIRKKNYNKTEEQSIFILKEKKTIL